MMPLSPLEMLSGMMIASWASWGAPGMGEDSYLDLGCPRAGDSQTGTRPKRSAEHGDEGGKRME